MDENVRWALYGPIDMFPYLGTRYGRAAALDVISRISNDVRISRFDRETVVLGIDSAASILSCCMTTRRSDRPIAVRVAHFAQFSSGRLMKMDVLLDTFDLVEQALGRSIRLPRMNDTDRACEP
ncbi:hypothetical protein GGD66_002470 [Bradyrhizobium sp. CIR48]|nr:hypothetical protein [Bradyrhizobium sp. CIR48]